MKSPLHRTSKNQTPGERASSAERSPSEHGRLSASDEFPPTERPSVEPFDAREPWPLSARVAVPWIVFNAVVLAGVLWTRPIDHGSTTPTSIAETTATAPPTKAVAELEGNVAAERGTTPEPSSGVSTRGSQEQAAEEQRAELTVYPVLVVEGRLFALEGPAQESGEHAVPRTDRTTTLALPGGGALGITARPTESGELPSGTWTVLSTTGTCLAERNRGVQLRLDTGDPSEPPPPALNAHELAGCTVNHDTTDLAVAIAGSHPDARFEATSEGTLQLRGGGRAADAAPDSCSGGVRITARSGEILSDQRDVELAGRITLDGRELLVLEGAGRGGGLRIVDVDDNDVTLAAEAPYSPLWLGASDC